MRKLTVSIILSLLFSFSMLANGATPAPKDAKVYIISPKNGAVVKSPVTVLFGLSNMGVAPAGVDNANTGHHHLLVDATDTPEMDKPIPKDEHHMHFGGGQTQTILKLSPGKHTLQLVMGDKNHIPLSPSVISKKITITVK